MRTFDELNADQRLDAYRIAKQELEETLRTGFIEFNKTMTSAEIIELAEEIAENANYDDNGKPYLEEIHVPYHFLGGCV